MKRKLPQVRLQFLSVFGLIAMISASMLMLGCDKKPTRGAFLIQVTASNSDQKGIKGAVVKINNKVLGKTDASGQYYGTHKGKVGAKIKIRVEGPGADNYVIMTSTLRIKKSKKGYDSVPIKVEAFLRSEGDADTGDTGDTGDKADAGDTGDSGDTNTPVAQNRPEVRAPENRVVKRTPPVRERVEPRPRRVASNNPRPQPRREVKEPSVPRDPVAPPSPRFNGRYQITVNCNVDGAYVYRGRRYAGKIKAGSAIVKYRTRSKSPGSLSIVVKLSRRTSYKYTQAKITKEVTLEYARAEYAIDVRFEERPPVEVEVRANLAGIKVKMDRKVMGTIDSPDTPLKFQYTGRPGRRVRFDLVPTDRKVRPRYVRRYKRIAADMTKVIVEGKFTAPAPPRPRVPVEARNPGVGTNLNPGGGAGQPEPPRLPPVAKFDGVYNITANTNAGGIKVYLGSRYKGTIKSAGTPLKIVYKTKRKKPGTLTLKFKAKNRYAFRVTTVSKSVPLEYGRAEYQINADFEKRPPLQIIATANYAGVGVSVSRTTLKGKTTGANKPLVLEYNGKPRRSFYVKFTSPGKQYTPRSKTMKVIVNKGQFSYKVNMVFQEQDLGSKPMKLRAFGRCRRCRLVALKSGARTAFQLKGDYNAPIGRTGKSGLLQVYMPVGSFQRVRATFSNGKTRDKVIEVKKGSGALYVSFSSVSKGCNLTRIKKKIRNQIFLEEEEVNCLRKVKSGNSQHFSSQLYLSRFYCQKKVYMSGKSILDKLYRNPRNRFNPYNALQMGIEYGRCKQYNRSLLLLKKAELMRTRFVAADRYANTKAMYRAMSAIYEQRYYRTKSTSDLVLSMKKMQRLVEILRSRDSGQRVKAKAEVTRLGKMVKERGGLED